MLADLCIIVGVLVAIRLARAVFGDDEVPVARVPGLETKRWRKSERLYNSFSDEYNDQTDA